MKNVNKKNLSWMFIFSMAIYNTFILHEKYTLL